MTASDEQHAYDDLAHSVMARVNASSVILLVVEGSKGTGLSLLTQNPKLALDLPIVLRRLADVLEKDGCEGWSPLTRGQA